MYQEPQIILPHSNQRETTTAERRNVLAELESVFVDYLVSIYGYNNFRDLTNLKLEEEIKTFTTPSNALRDERINRRFTQTADQSPEQIIAAKDLSVPQYQIFAKYKKYFTGEQTLPYLIPNELFYKLGFEDQTKIIEEIEQRGLFVRENLDRINFPDTTTDRMFPRDPLARIHPELKEMAKHSPAKIVQTLEEAIEKEIPGRSKSFKDIAQENTQEQLNLYLGTTDTPETQDLLKPEIFAESLTRNVTAYQGILFTKKDIVNRLQAQRTREFEPKFTIYIDQFLTEELPELRRKNWAKDPDDIATLIKSKILSDLKTFFFDGVPESQFFSKTIQEIKKSLTEEILNALNSTDLRNQEKLSVINSLKNGTVNYSLADRFTRFPRIYNLIRLIQELY